MSGDRDTVQLVYGGRLNGYGTKYDPCTSGLVTGPASIEGWTVVWTNSWKNQTFYVPQGWNDVKADVFDMTSTTDVNSVTNLSRDLFATVTELADPSSIVFQKILLGDDGDDVPAVWDDGNKRLTPSKAKIVFEYLEKKGFKGEEWPVLSMKEDVLLDMCGTILRTMSAIDGTPERKAVMENLRRNERLVWLEPQSLPKPLFKDIMRHLEERKLEADEVRDPSQWKRSSILKGGKFEGDAVSKSHDPFAFLELP